MTVDTLKFALGLQRRGFSREQAEGLADEIAALLEPLDTIRREIAIVKWMIGANIVVGIATAGLLLQH